MKSVKGKDRWRNFITPVSRSLGFISSRMPTVSVMRVPFSACSASNRIKKAARSSKYQESVFKAKFSHGEKGGQDELMVEIVRKKVDRLQFRYNGPQGR